jgi:aspartate kinase
VASLSTNDVFPAWSRLLMIGWVEDALTATKIQLRGQVISQQSEVVLTSRTRKLQFSLASAIELTARKRSRVADRIAQNSDGAPAVRRRPGRRGARHQVTRELDALLSTGEKVTTALLSMALGERAVRAKSFSANQVGILTDSAHNKARIQDIKAEALQAELEVGGVPVVAGFQGVDVQGNVTTLGRGGSDTTAVALAAALKADECQIYTDVDGVYTTDPRMVDGAKRLDQITFEEMLEMSSMGSKVLQIRSVEFAGKYKVPLRVLSSFEDGPGTLITTEEDASMEAPVIAGIAFNRDEAKLTVVGVPDNPGMAYRILGPVGEANIEVDVILQNSRGENSTDFTFTVADWGLDAVLISVAA